MSDEACEEMRLLIQADVDGELRPAEAARVAAHLEHCAGCAEIQARLIALSTRLRSDAPRYSVSPALRDAVEAAVRAAAPGHAPAPGAVARAGRRGWMPMVPGLSFGAGFAVAACLALLLIMPGAGALPEAVVSAHIRALQPGHLMDVVSTDQHTVKPWFDGRLPFAPDVRDLATKGFPLIGGRLDYISGRTVAVLIYRHGKHVIELFAWPDAGVPAPISSSGDRNGYNFLHWNQDGNAFWAVSDINARDLAEFQREWRAF